MRITCIAFSVAVACKTWRCSPPMWPHSIYVNRPICIQKIYCSPTEPGPLTTFGIYYVEMAIWHRAIELGRVDLFSSIAAAGGLYVISTGAFDGELKFDKFELVLNSPLHEGCLFREDTISTQNRELSLFRFDLMLTTLFDMGLDLNMFADLPDMFQYRTKVHPLDWVFPVMSDLFDKFIANGITDFQVARRK